MLDDATRKRLEWEGDALEVFARQEIAKVTLLEREIRSTLMALAWDLKQAARKGTPSEGI
jgi:hypothetical protein